MPDGPFKSMARDSSSARFHPNSDSPVLATSVECEVCHGRIFEGDWPWCNGNPSEHARD